MRLRGWKPAALAIACVAGLAGPSRPAPPSPWTPHGRPPVAPPTAPPAAPQGQKRPALWINDQPDTGQFLPDTVLLARVGDRSTRVSDYIDAYFRSYAEYRPRPDSAGRIEFLNSMINKDVLGLTALAINRPFGFEDRAVMREHTERVLSNVLYQRAVLDSVTIGDDEMRQLYEQYKYALRLRHIQFTLRDTAEKVRRDLIAGRIAWKNAVRRSSTASDSDRDGEIGWRNRTGFDAFMAYPVFSLKPGGFSPVLQDAGGYQLIQVMERRPENPPSYEDLRSALRSELRSVKTDQRVEGVQALLRAEIGMVHDSTNIAWAASIFTPTRSSGRGEGGTTLEFNTALPEFSPADTSRVLARHRYGQLTLGGLLDAYGQIQPLLRPSLNDFESLRSYVDGVVLEPYMAQLAIRRGLDKDPLATRQIESRREEILVNHMYDDSISSKVWIKPEERRKYYESNLAGFITYARVSYAAFVRPSRPAADSLAARLRAGEKAQDLLRADSLMGRTTGSIQQRSQNEQGTPYYKLLFEELRPGKVAVEGPDRMGDYAVLQLLSFDPGRQLSYEEAQHYIDESLQNMRAEELLKAFLARHRKRFKIEAHPELLMRVRLVEPGLVE